MSNFKGTKTELINYLIARTPLVIIDTNERERVERMLAGIASELGDKILYYTESGDVKTIGNSADVMKTNDDPLGFFFEKMKKQRRLNIVLGDVQNISTDSFYARDLMNLLYLANSTDSVVMLITSEPVWNRISGFGMSIKLDLPDVDERQAQIREFMKKAEGRYEIEWDNEDILRAGAILKGFTEIQIENILSTEVIGSKGLYKKRISSLASQKQKIYGKTDAVQYIEVPDNIEIAGMEHLKSWLNDKREIFFTPYTVLGEYDLKAPKGILLVGVPGCGKSITAKLVSKEWGLPLFRFDIGSVYDKWVGGSEKRMRESLRFIENVSPCILWIDEIEKVISDSDSDNDTGKRVLGEFLFWMQESNFKVFIVATANNVKALPYELYRKGRFSEIFFVGLPDKTERESVIRQYARRSLHCELDEKTVTAVAEKTEGFSNSDLEAVVKEVAQKSLICKGLDDVEGELIKVAENVIPISKVNSELVKEITDWGSDRAIHV